MEFKSKKEYCKPSIEDFGTVTELTATGKSNPGGDGKVGSVNSNGA
jgi:hypothetical protein